MALNKKPAFDISGQLNQMQSTVNGDSGSAENTLKPLKDIPEQPAKSYIPAADYGQSVTKAKKKKKVDTSVMVGFRLPVEAKDQYKEYFEQFGLNLSEATKNALEYFIADLQKGKVKITLTHHFERVDEE